MDRDEARYKASLASRGWGDGSTQPAVAPPMNNTYEGVILNYDAEGNVTSEQELMIMIEDEPDYGWESSAEEGTDNPPAESHVGVAEEPAEQVNAVMGHRANTAERSRLLGEYTDILREAK